MASPSSIYGSNKTLPLKVESLESALFPVENAAGKFSGMFGFERRDP